MLRRRVAKAPNLILQCTGVGGSKVIITRWCTSEAGDLSAYTTARHSISTVKEKNVPARYTYSQHDDYFSSQQIFPICTPKLSRQFAFPKFFQQSANFSRDKVFTNRLKLLVRKVILIGFNWLIRSH